MSGEKRFDLDRSESTDTCPVCHDPFEIFAIGPCDHFVCYKCSTRMRVLCETSDCPICRSLNPQVAFVRKRQTFKDISLRNCIPNRKYKIFFQDEDIEDLFLDLLEYRCRICRNRGPEKSFASLQTHMRREHQLFACQLCEKHLKIFPFERKFYNRKNLAIHRRIGDEDDKSYKGHPLCEFCDTRYFDKDELLKHLRKDHYYCHFCDQEGSNAYYDQYSDLRKHFSESHFLCDEGECSSSTTRFTHAFATEIDLKAHKASVHSKNMSKAQFKEARTIDVAFQLPPRRSGRGGAAGITSDDFEDLRGGRGRAGGSERYNRRRHHRDDDNDADLQRALEASKEAATNPTPQEKIPDPVHDFPTLDGAIVQPVIVEKVPKTVEEEYPSLSSTSASKSAKAPIASKPYSSIMNPRAEVKAPPPPVKTESKPVSLGTISKNAQSRHNAHRPPPSPSDDEDPSLGGKGHGSSSLNSGNWLQNAKTVVPSAAPPTRTLTLVNSNQTKENGFVRSKPTTFKSTISDEKEFPTLAGDGAKRNRPASSPFSDWSKQNGASRKILDNTPRSEKVDDDAFELPDSYFKSYDNSEPCCNISLTKSISELVPERKPPPKPVPPSNAREFPGLPTRESTKENPNHNFKKKKTKPKKAGQGPSQKKSVVEDSNASLSDIALALVKPEPKQSNGKKFNPPAKKPSKPTDWFENPLAGLDDDNKTPSPRSGMSRYDNNQKEQLTKDTPSRIGDTDNFPSLHTMTSSVEQPKPPPGFSSSSASKPTAVSISSNFSAPPGFKAPAVSMNSTPSAPPPGFAPNSIYTQPPEFKSRNLKLIEDIRQCLETVEDGFTNFRALSGYFRQGMMEASDYYLSCEDLMGEGKFTQVFPELLALLPDIEKQRELWDIHQANLSSAGHSWQSAQKLSQCQICGQVALKRDFQDHQFQHENHKDFPSLNNNSQTPAGNPPGLSRGGSVIKAK